MGIKPFIFSTIVVVCAPTILRANCETENNADKVVECLLNKHPAIALSKKNIEIASGSVKESFQMINPSLEWEMTEAQQASGFSNEINLKHTIELGSKRSARKKLAQSRKSIETIGVEKTYNQLKIGLITDLYRLRQIEHETEVIKENQLTFNKMISQYRKNSRLNPEQEISVNVFSMAAEEVRLKLQKLENERDQILSDFDIINQSAFVPKKEQLPPLNHRWPELKASGLNGALIKEAQARVVESEKNYRLQKANTWPNLAVGPRVLDAKGPQGGTFFGIAASLTLPVLNTNKGGREKALAKKNQAEIYKSYLNRRVLAEAKRLKKVYARSSESYSKALKRSKVQQKHARIHKLIKRGVVSPPMVIELHRQTIEFYESLHQQELEAVTARWNYYSLFSNLNERKINDDGGV